MRDEEIRIYELGPVCAESLDARAFAIFPKRNKLFFFSLSALWTRGKHLTSISNVWCVSQVPDPRSFKKPKVLAPSSFG